MDLPERVIRRSPLRGSKRMLDSGGVKNRKKE